MKSSKFQFRKYQKGQGMTEYIIIVALIAIAAIGVFSIFGNTVKNQVSAMTSELAGKDGTAQVKAAGAEAARSTAAAGKRTNLGNYGNQASK